MKIKKKKSQVKSVKHWVRTNSIALVALCTSVGLPFLFRYLDKKQGEPDISMSLTYLDRRNVMKDPELIRRITDKCNPLQTFLRLANTPETAEEARNIFLWQDYRIFKLTIINKRNHPVALHEIKTTNYDFVFTEAKTNNICGMTHVYLLDKINNDVEASPTINLAPNEIKTVQIVFGTFGLPTYCGNDAIIELHKQTMKFLLEQGGNTNLHLSRADFLSIPFSNKTNIGAIIYFPILEEQFLSKGRLIRAQISAVDQTGRTVLSNIASGPWATHKDYILSW